MRESLQSRFERLVRRVLVGASLPGGTVYQSQGPLNSFLTSLSPNGSGIECGHDANCEIGALWLGGFIGRANPMRAPQACPTPVTFTRQHPRGIGGGLRGANGPLSGYGPGWDGGLSDFVNWVQSIHTLSEEVTHYIYW